MLLKEKKRFDYYAFGMEMPGRSIGSDFAYNFNGKRTDKWNGDNSSYLDFGARIHDARLGRLLSLDPLKEVAPNKSAYSFAANNPIYFIDVEGAYVIHPTLAKKYPKLNQMLWMLDDWVNAPGAQNNPFLRELAQAVGLNPSDPNDFQYLIETFSYGSGPILTEGNYYNDNGRTNDMTLDVSISILNLEDLENKTHTLLAGNSVDGYFKSGGVLGPDDIWNAANILSMINTLLHEGGHHMSLKYGCGTPNQNYANASNGWVDNMNSGFETQLWKVGAAPNYRPMNESSDFKSAILDIKSVSKNIQPIGNLRTNNVLSYFRRFEGRKNDVLQPEHLDMKTMPLPTEKHNEEIK